MREHPPDEAAARAWAGAKLATFPADAAEHLAREVDSAIFLALAESPPSDPLKAAREAVREEADALFGKHSARGGQASSGLPDDYPESRAKPPGIRPVGDRSPEERARDERDAVVAIAAHAGVSERMLGRVFGMAPSQIHAIVAAARARRLPGPVEAADPIDREIARLSGLGRSQREIGAAVGLCPQAVGKRLRRMGLSMHGRYGRLGPREREIRDALVLDARGRRIPSEAIVRIFRVSPAHLARLASRE